MLRLLIGGLLLFWEAQLIVAQSPEARPSATIPEKWMPNWMRRCLLGSDHTALNISRLNFRQGLNFHFAFPAIEASKKFKTQLKF